MCGNWDPPTLVVGMKNGAAMIENTMEDPKKFKNITAMITRKKKKIELLHDLEIPPAYVPK